MKVIGNHTFSEEELKEIDRISGGNRQGEER